MTPVNGIELDPDALPRYVVVEGAIGVGKTTLSKKLAQTFNYDTLLEDSDSNPFLSRFYSDRKQHALPTQLFFLFKRAEQLRAMHQDDLFQPVRVADFLIEKDPLFAGVTLDKDELAIYQQVYDNLKLQPPKPDLVIYLQAPVDTLLKRIRLRGIEAEQQIDSEYLRSINEAYTRFFHYYEDAPLLIVNASNIDWVNNEASYRHLVEYLLKIKRGRHYYNPTDTLL